MERMTEQITVGYDGSDSSSEAVLWAAEEAVARRAPLHIVACRDHMASLAAGTAAFPEAGAVLSSSRAMETVLARMVGVVEQSHPDLRLTAETQPGPRPRPSWTASKHRRFPDSTLCSWVSPNTRSSAFSAPRSSPQAGASRLSWAMSSVRSACTSR
jgi:hypothetical protein